MAAAVPVLIGGALFQSANEGVAFVLDLSEQKRAEEKIREQEMELRQILDLTPQHVAVIGPGHDRIFANRALLNYFGLSLEEWQSRGTQTRVHPDDIERLAWGPQGGPPDQYEARLRRYDGTYRWFLVRNNPLHDEQGQITRWFVAGTDIDDRKQAEERLRQENVALREEIDKTSMFEEIVGTSRPLKAVLSRIAKVAPTDSTVLITGETGTGKELIARAVHKRSQRSGRPFVSVNCAALPPTLVSSELFGHEKGAFTGATQRRLGRFEMADGGTIFLDEVGELLPDTQAALLRVLQEREFERVGGGQPIHSRRSRHRCHESRLERRRSEWDLPPGSPLSAECVSHRNAAFARTERRHFDAGRVFRAALRQPGGQKYPIDRPEDLGSVAVLRLAWQHP